MASVRAAATRGLYLQRSLILTGRTGSLLWLRTRDHYRSVGLNCDCAAAGPPEAFVHIHQRSLLDSF